MFERNQDHLNILAEDSKVIKIPAGFAYQLPPNSFGMLHGEFWDYSKRQRLLTKFHIAKCFSNPQGTVQGGILTACFDDTFGPLGISAARKPIVTIDINVQFIRPVPLEKDFFIETKVISMGRTTIYMEASAYNEKGKLLAKSTTNQLILT